MEDSPFLFVCLKNQRLLTYFVSFDFRFDALFLCQVFLLASLSTMLITFGRKVAASCLSVIFLSFAIDVRADFL